MEVYKYKKTCRYCTKECGRKNTKDTKEKKCCKLSDNAKAVNYFLDFLR